MAPAAAIARGFHSDAALPRQIAQPRCALPQESNSMNASPHGAAVRPPARAWRAFP